MKNKDHFAIPVKNSDESEKFYKMLGFVEVNRWEKTDQKLTGILLEKDNSRLELVYHPTNVNISFPEIIAVLHLGMEVDELEKVIEQLESGGTTIAKPITKGVSVEQFAFIRDPNGFAIELFEAKR